MTGADITSELGAELGGGRLITDPDLIESYRRDQTHVVPPGAPCAVVQARGVDDVVATLRWASRHRVPVVPRGSGTSLSGGATAVDGCVMLSLAAMTRIIELSVAERLAVVEAGVINADLDHAARAHGLMYAPDPSSYEISTIGGNLATNAGGLRCLKYGVTRDAALGLEVVLADGRVIRTGRRTAKGVTGYDLTGLLVGSEGTLGVITSATVRLRPVPPGPPVTVAAPFGSLAAAAEAVAAIVKAGVDTSLLELIDRATLVAIDDWKHIGLDPDTRAMLIAQCDGPLRDEAARQVAGHCAAAGAADVAISADEAEAALLLDLRRLAYPATERLGACLDEDVCVPVPALAAMIGRIEAASAAHGVLITTVAHAGDGNLHPVFVYDRGLPAPPPAVWAAADEVFTAALALGGTLTGEHGVGAVKTRWLDQELSPATRDAQRAIKAALDPLGILNPGRAILAATP
jgi:glycolate oxidase